MKSTSGADAPPDALHKSQASLDSHSLGFALTAEQAQLNAIFAGVAEAIVLVDEEGEVQRINPRIYAGFRMQRRRRSGPAARGSHRARRSFGGT